MNIAMIHLKIRAGVGKLNEEFISGRIKSILTQSNAPDAEVSGSMWQDYIIKDVPKEVSDSVYKRMNSERGFEPLLYK
jgi:regulator of protease activity HflC (stomatin/prohibitin superfamily)